MPNEKRKADVIGKIGPGKIPRTPDYYCQVVLSIEVGPATADERDSMEEYLTHYLEHDIKKFGAYIKATMELPSGFVVQKITSFVE